MDNETNSRVILKHVFSIEIIILPILILFGTICNIMTFIVMRRRRMRISSTCFYMAVLAVTDTFVLWTGCVNQWFYLINVQTFIARSNLTCKLITFLFFFFADASVWITVCMSFERYFAVSRPLRASQTCTTRRAKWVLAMVFVILFLIDGQFLVTYQLDVHGAHRICHSKAWAQHFVEKVFVYIDALKYSMIPFCLLLLLSILIIQRVFHAENISAQLRNLRQLSNYQKYSVPSSSSFTGRSSSVMMNSTQTTSLSSTRVGRRITFMLLSVSIAFCVFSAPMALMQIVQSVSKPGHNEIPLAIGKAIAELCQYINHSCNFFLYALTGRIFRREFVRLFFPTRLGNGIHGKTTAVPRIGLNGPACLTPQVGQTSSRHYSLYSVDNNRLSPYPPSRHLTALSLKNCNNQINRPQHQLCKGKSPMMPENNKLMPIDRRPMNNHDKLTTSTNKTISDRNALHSFWHIISRHKEQDRIGDGPYMFVKVLQPTHTHCQCF